MEVSGSKRLKERLQTGRVFLFLGFDYLRGTFDHNPTLQILEEIFERKFNQFSDIYNSDYNIDISSSFHRLKNKIDNVPTNMVLGPISKIKWNSVYTSSIDDLCLSRLANNNRSTKAICNNSREVTFSRSELSINYLFGLFNRSEPYDAVPTSKVNFVKRKRTANLMLNELVESMSPLDTLVINGWDEKSDPFDAESLFGALSVLQKGQCFIFDTSNSVSNEYIADLINSKMLVNVKKSLFEFIEEDISELYGDIGEDNEFDSFIKLKKQIIEIPSQIRRKVQQFGHILEDNDFHLSKVKDVNRKDIYSDFLYDSTRNPHWIAYSMNLDFRRNYITELLEITSEQLSKSQVSTSPVILHGSTGTGKSVGLGRLCYELYKQEKFVVIHIQKSIDTIDYREINDVCEWVESKANAITVICWDGMLNIESYEGLSNFLSNRGRKQIVIGSTYKIKKPKSSLFIEANYFFSKDEKDRFYKYVSENVADNIHSDVEFDSAFLVALFRMLPNTRFNLTSGVVDEAVRTQQFLKSSLELTTTSPETAIEAAFMIALGNSERNSKLLSGNDLLDKIDFSDILDAIMVFGQFGIDTPIDLLMRFFPKLKVSNFAEILSNVDIIKWSENQHGDILLSPRNSLEADIYCKRLINKPEDHVKCLIGFIGVVEQKKLYQSLEINFCAEAVKAFGPNGTKGKLYVKSYLDISQALDKAIKDNKLSSSRLMLQQSNLSREYGRRTFKKEEFNNEYFEILKHSLDVIEDGINIEEKRMGNNRKSNYAILPLLGEKTSILGTLANQIANKPDADVQDIKFYIHKALESAKEALKYKMSNYLSLDSIAWIAIDYSSREVALDVHQISILVRAIAVFDEHSVNDFEPRFQSDFLIRKSTLNSLVSKKGCEDNALEELKVLDIADYHYFRVTKLLNSIDMNQDSFSPREIEIVQTGLDYLRDEIDIPLDSFKLNVITLKLYWLVTNKKALLQGERCVVRQPVSFWDEVLDLTSKIIKSANGSNKIIYEFVHALALFNKGNYELSARLFKEIDTQSDSISGARRVFKSFLLSNENGPRKFTGEVKFVDSGGAKGELYIDELGTSVPFVTRDFRVDRDDIGKQLMDLHVSFNFRGAIIEKAKFYKGSK